MAGFSCPICSESLSKLPAEAAQKIKGRPKPLERDDLNISTTPCGHLFHSYCIQKWLSGTLLSSGKCPCCRKDVPGRSCIPLYPTPCEESFTEDTQNFNICNHGRELCKLRRKVTTLEKSLNEKNQLYTLLSDDCENLNKKLSTDRETIELWMLRAKQHESYKDIVKDQKKEIKKLQTAMETYPDELRISARQLADSRKEKQLYLREKSALLNKIEKFKKANEQMHIAFTISTTKPHSTQSRGRLNEHEKPKTVYTKRKGPSPETTVYGESTDRDVEIIESPLPKYKKSQDSKPKAKQRVSSDTDEEFISH